MALQVMTVFGSRPEAIKMAPVAIALKADPAINSIICVTAQHRQLLDQAMKCFDLKADIDLDLMQPEQDLYDITSRVLLGMRDAIKKIKPDLILVHGDTSTSLAAALAAFYQKVPIGHVEAGLRTLDVYAPFPEEANRSMIARIAQWHFTPTAQAAKNLLAENIPGEKIYITGNTVIDALLIARRKVKQLHLSDWQNSLGFDLAQQILQRKSHLVLITAHRRENIGSRFINLCKAICDLALRHADWIFVYPVHPNPNIRQPAYAMLASLANVKLIDPLDYLSFVWLMDQSDLILTDSGGIQEEGPSLGKPVLVMRDLTERTEALTAGTIKLVGTNSESIVNEVEYLFRDENAYRAMATAYNPYGSGNASQKIIGTIKKWHNNF